MLEIEDLNSFYGAAHVLHGVTLHVAEREVLALLGRNGMGKTTLVRSIMGLTPPRIGSGTIRWDGQSLTGLTPYQIAATGIAIVPQGRRLFPSLTVTEHLTCLKPVRARHGWTVARLFELFPRLGERRQHRGNQLSGGERGLLAFARALVTDPRLLLLDEPSEGLAPVMVQYVEQVIQDLKQSGLAILLVEQNLRSALLVADRVCVLESGQVAYSGLPNDEAAITRYLGL